MTLNEMIQSDFITEMINQENRDLAEAGWTIKEVRAMAQFITDVNN
tara:strand:- start:104 stop:241 length:138 start_codon:yes stop_codon:yes gene_type:complete